LTPMTSETALHKMPNPSIWKAPSCLQKVTCNLQQGFTYYPSEQTPSSSNPLIWWMKKEGLLETSLYDTNEIAISTWQWAVGQTHEYASHKLHTRCSAWYTVSFDSVWCGICTAWILLMVPCSLPCVPKNQLSQSLSNLQTTSKYSTST
jgi:hypothetical protein